MFHSLSNNMTSPKSFNSSNGPFIYPAPAQTRGKIFLCYCSVQLLEPGKWNAWDLQKLLSTALLKEIPWSQAILQGLVFEQPHSIKLIGTRHSNGTHKLPGTNHLSLLARSLKKCYFSVSTPKLNWERTEQQRKHFTFNKLTALSTFSFFFFLSIATNRSTWKDLCGALTSLTIFLWNLLIKHHY